MNHCLKLLALNTVATLARAVCRYARTHTHIPIYTGIRTHKGYQVVNKSNVCEFILQHCKSKKKKNPQEKKNKTNQQNNFTDWLPECLFWRKLLNLPVFVLIALSQPDLEGNCWPKMEIETLLNISMNSNCNRLEHWTCTYSLPTPLLTSYKCFYSQTHFFFRSLHTTLARM